MREVRPRPPAEIIPGRLSVDDRGLPAHLHGIGLKRVGGRRHAWLSGGEAQ